MAWTHQVVERDPELVRSLVSDALRPSLGLDLSPDELRDAPVPMHALARDLQDCRSTVEKARFTQQRALGKGSERALGAGVAGAEWRDLLARLTPQLRAYFREALPHLSGHRLTLTFPYAFFHKMALEHQGELEPFVRAWLGEAATIDIRFDEAAVGWVAMGDDEIREWEDLLASAPALEDGWRVAVTNIEWEYQIRNSRGTVMGSADLRVTFDVDVCGLVQERNGGRQWTWSRLDRPKGLAVYFEVKPQILSIGEVLRQINKYRLYTPGGTWVVVTPLDRYARLLASQKIKLLIPSEADQQRLPLGMNDRPAELQQVFDDPASPVYRAGFEAGLNAALKILKSTRSGGGSFDDAARILRARISGPALPASGDTPPVR